LADEPRSADPVDTTEDSERVAATARLQELVANGELSLDRFSQALERVLAARTRADLEAAMTGMPPLVHLTPSARRLAQPLEVATGLQHLRLGPGWQLASRTTVSTGTGKCTLDLTAATWDSLEVDLHLRTATGAIDVIIPEGVAVQMASVKGNVKLESLVPPAPASPLLRVFAETGVGRVRFRHPREPRPAGQARWRLGRRRRRS
jgi:hypothetical protein